MFGKESFFKSRGKSTEVTQLNLDRTPPAKPVPPPSNSTATPLSLAETLAVPSDAQARIDGIVKQLLETGANTALLAYIGNPAKSATYTLSPAATAKRPIPLFSSPLLALDYMRANRIDASVLLVKMPDLPAHAESWRAAGVDSFVFNLCPRCPVGNILTPGNGVITVDQVRFAWVLYRALRQWRGQRAVQNFVEAKSDHAAQRVTLELVRDHFDYANPYVHWLIALIAGIQGDEPARLAATASLEDFGPAFKGKTAVIADHADPKAWGTLFFQANVGFAKSYDVIVANPSRPSISSVLGIANPV